MKRRTLLSYVAMSWTILATLIGFAACSNDAPTPDPDKPIEPVNPNELQVAILNAHVEGELTLKFSVQTSNATEVSYLCVEGDNLPDENTVLAEGSALEPNKEVAASYTAEKYETTYQIVVVAKNEEEQKMVSKKVTTKEEPAPEAKTPTITLSQGEATDCTLTFTVTTAYAEEAKWVCIEKDSRDLTAAQVLKNGTALTGNNEETVTAEGLKSLTTFEIYVAARNGEIEILSDPLEMTTLEAAPVYENFTVNGSHASVNITRGENGDPHNYYITIFDQEQNLSFKGDFYASPEYSYLPSGVYPLGEAEAGYTTSQYTSFFDEINDTKVRKFKTGSITVEATPNEESGEVHYTMEGEFELLEGGFVSVNYDGTILGIELPKEEVDLSVIQLEPVAVERKDYGDPGSYILYLRDKDWNELYIEILVDPETCNQGKDPLPAGSYSMSEGTITDYTKVTLYTPNNFMGTFETATAEVSVNDAGYTILFEGLAKYSAATSYPERTIRVNYTGEISNMILE